MLRGCLARFAIDDRDQEWKAFSPKLFLAIVSGLHYHCERVINSRHRNRRSRVDGNRQLAINSSYKNNEAKGDAHASTARHQVQNV